MLYLRCLITALLALSLWYLLKAFRTSRSARAASASITGGDEEECRHIEFADCMSSYHHNVAGAFCTLLVLVGCLCFLPALPATEVWAAPLAAVHAVFAVALLVLVAMSRFSPFSEEFMQKHCLLIRSALWCVTVAAPTGLWLLWA